LWGLKGVKLITSAYALDEARRNLQSEDQKARLEGLIQFVEVLKESLPGRELPHDIHLPAKDRPILIAAIEAKATHLITGDFRDFGGLYGRTIQGVTILPPAGYLRGKE